MRSKTSNQSDDFSVDVELDFDEQPAELTGFVGAYHLLGRIGGGGMGAVYRARSVHPKRLDEIVAIKVFSKEAVSDAIQLKHCLDEAYLLSLLDHSNVIRTFESGTHDGQLYIVMDYIDGIDLIALLSDLRQKNVVLPTAVVTAIFYQLLDAIDYVHRATGAEGKPLGLVHRDVCPSNVFVGRDARVMLGDFSISLSNDDRPRNAEQLIAGHLGYMPPEQFLGGAADPRSDLFGLSAVLYRMLVGSAPFEERQPKKSYAEAAKGDWKKLPAMDKGKELTDLLVRGLAPKVKNRFQTVAELRTAFSAIFPPSVLRHPALAALVRVFAPPAEVVGPTAAPKAAVLGKVVVWSEKPDHRAARVALLATAGQQATPLATRDELLKPNAEVAVIDLVGADGAAIDAVNKMQLPVVVGLADLLTTPTLALASRLRCQWLTFAPFAPELLARGLAEAVAARRSEQTPARPPVRKSVASRRVILVGFTPTESLDLSEHLGRGGVSVDAWPSHADAIALGPQRSYHLLLRQVAAVDDNIWRDVREFRAQLGYAVVPVVLRVGDARSLRAASASTLEAVTLLAGSGPLAGLGDKVKDLLATHSARAFSRLPVSIPVSYTYRGVASTGTLTDVGRLGALLRCDQVLHAGDAIGLTCTLPTGATLHLEPTVAHIRLGDAGNFFIGLDLAAMSAQQEASWLRYLATVTRR